MPNANRYKSLPSIRHSLTLNFCPLILNVVVHARSYAWHSWVLLAWLSARLLNGISYAQTLSSESSPKLAMSTLLNSANSAQSSIEHVGSGNLEEIVTALILSLPNSDSENSTPTQHPSFLQFHHCPGGMSGFTKRS